MVKEEHYVRTLTIITAVSILCFLGSYSWFFDKEYNSILIGCVLLITGIAFLIVDILYFKKMWEDTK